MRRKATLGWGKRWDFLGSSSRIIWSTETKIPRAKAALIWLDPSFCALGSTFSFFILSFPLSSTRHKEKQGICILLLLLKVYNTVLESTTIHLLPRCSSVAFLFFSSKMENGGEMRSKIQSMEERSRKRLLGVVNLASVERREDRSSQSERNHRQSLWDAKEGGKEKQRWLEKLQQLWVRTMI